VQGRRHEQGANLAIKTRLDEKSYLDETSPFRREKFSEKGLFLLRQNICRPGDTKRGEELGEREKGTCRLVERELEKRKGGQKEGGRVGFALAESALEKRGRAARAPFLAVWLRCEVFGPGLVGVKGARHGDSKV